ncbi:hypothetical protein [Haloarcula sp. K1]|uniref:hypothetical protein n=1 Tax=Haloarcula sp. K1 TaxID=1622207 RepID=UPI0007BB72E8|nr:hypothetical protein [Haloarcula sp. K1]KZX46306.1 hypothetical protein AV929_16175 [Haloarcula sp. K1]
MGERDLAGLGDSLANPDEDDDDEAKQSTESDADDKQEEQSAESISGTDEQPKEEIFDDTESTSTQTQQPADQSTALDGNSTSSCQEITRDGTQCDHDAQPGSSYCKKHQPDKFGNRPGEFQRKQWNLLPEVIDGLFADSVTADSVYIDVQKEVGESFQKKSIENKMGEFLLEHREEFIDFVSSEYSEHK